MKQKEAGMKQKEAGVKQKEAGMKAERSGHKTKKGFRKTGFPSGVHRPGFEPGLVAWKATIIAARPSVHQSGSQDNA